MQNKILITVMLFLAVAITLGCKALLVDKPDPTSMMVTSGLLSTNEVNALEWIRLVAQINKTVNVTPTTPIVNSLLAGIAAIAAAAAGYAAKHYGEAKPTKTSSKG